MTATADRVVTIEYTLTASDGEVLDSSRDTGPFPYLHGHENIVPGLESSLEGKEVGARVEVTLQPEDAYGRRDEALVMTVPRERIPADALEIGAEFAVKDPAGEHAVVRLVSIADDTVTLDGNHPLADQVLTFDVTILEIREAEPEELEHGHVHGPDGHDHDHDED